MIHYSVKLTKSEVEELMSIINKGSHTSQTFRAAYILIAPLTVFDISKRIKVLK